MSTSTSFQRMSLSPGAELFDEDVLGQTLTPKQVLLRLQLGWVNEKIGPELLPPLEQEKEAMLQQIKQMENNALSLDKADIRTEIHKLELERIKFVVVSYMRTRLFKLQQMSFYYHALEMKRPPTKPSIIMPEEMTFVKKFVERTEEYLRTVLIAKLPTTLQKFDTRKFKIAPHMDSYVFVRVLNDLDIEVEDSHEETHIVQLKEGEQHVMRYKPIAKLISTNSISLV